MKRLLLLLVVVWGLGGGLVPGHNESAYHKAYDSVVSTGDLAIRIGPEPDTAPSLATT